MLVVFIGIFCFICDVDVVVLYMLLTRNFLFCSVHSACSYTMVRSRARAHTKRLSSVKQFNWNASKCARILSSTSQIQIRCVIQYTRTVNYVYFWYKYHVCTSGQAISYTMHRIYDCLKYFQQEIPTDIPINKWFFIDFGRMFAILFF